MRFAASPSILTISKLLTMALPLLTAPVVARELGPFDRGLYAACAGVLTISPVVLGLGVPLAIRKRAAHERGPEAMRTLYRVWPMLLLASVGLGLVAIVFLLPGLTTQSRIWFAIAIGSTSLQTVALGLQSLLIVQKRYASVAFIQASLNTSIAVGVLVAWWLGSLSIHTLLAVWSVGSVIMTAVGLISARVNPIGRAAPVTALYADGVKYAGSQIAEVGSNTLVQVLAVTLIGATATGYLAIATTIAGIPLVLGFAIGIVAYREVATASPDQRDSLIRDVYRASSALGIAASAVLAASSPWLIPLLFGSAYTSSVVPTLILLVGSALMVPNYVGSQLLAASGRGWSMTIAQTAGLVTSIAALALLAVFATSASLGAILAALAVVMGRVTTNLVSASALSLGWQAFLPRLSDFKRGVRMLARGDI